MNTAPVSLGPQLSSGTPPWRISRAAREKIEKLTGRRAKTRYVDENRIGDHIWYISDDKKFAMVDSTPGSFPSSHFAVVMRGYTPAPRTIGIDGITILPYVNGCSTKQLVPPPRAGDPTLQYLLIPPFSKEQAHHIHSTVRAVYVLSGKGVSIVGMEGGTVT